MDKKIKANSGALIIGESGEDVQIPANLTVTGTTTFNNGLKPSADSSLLSKFIDIPSESSTMSGVVQGVESTLNSILIFGHRLGNSISLGFAGSFDIVTGNNFDYIQIPLSSFPSLSGLSISRISGSFGTNVNTTSGAIVGGFVTSGGGIQLNLVGNAFLNQTGRSFTGTMMLLVS